MAAQAKLAALSGYEEDLAAHELVQKEKKIIGVDTADRRAVAACGGARLPTATEWRCGRDLIDDTCMRIFLVIAILFVILWRWIAW